MSIPHYKQCNHALCLVLIKAYRGQACKQNKNYKKNLKEKAVMPNFYNYKIVKTSSYCKNDKFWEFVKLNIMKVVYKVLYTFSVVPSVINQKSQKCYSIE